MTTAAPPKLCFVISAIGAKDGPDRIRADWLLHNVIKPVLEHDPFNYVVTRADEIADPGLITDQVITSVENADLVVADLGHFGDTALNCC